jgi:hypothetical protein
MQHDKVQYGLSCKAVAYFKWIFFCERSSIATSAMGHSRPKRDVRCMSAFPPIAPTLRF